MKKRRERGQVDESVNATPARENTDVTDDVSCPECGYDLRGITSDRCPECGFAVDRAAMSASQIPWAHRRQIGRARAFWRTTRLAIFHPRRLADEMNRSVSLSDAQRFRHVAVFLAWLPLAAWVVGATIPQIDLPRYFHRGARLGWTLEAVSFVVAICALWLFLLTASGAGSYFFHPKKLSIARQNRAIALSYYSCAALAWVWLPLLLLATVQLCEWAGVHGLLEQFELVAIILAGALTLAIVIAWWWDAIALMRLVTHCGRSREILFALYLPLAWAVLLALAAAIPLVVAYVSFILLSLR